MGLASNQARLNVLTSRKADLEYRLIMITNQTQQLAANKAEAVAKKSAAVLNYVNAATNEDEKVSFENTAAYMDYETSMAELEAADSRLTQQQKTVETELQAVQAEEEEIEKLVSSNIKKSFGYFN